MIIGVKKLLDQKHGNYAVHETEAKWKDYSAYYPKALLERGRAKVIFINISYKLFLTTL